MKYLLPLIFFYSVALGQGFPTGPLQFVKDKKTTNVLQDTVTPANNVGLPVNVVAGSLSASNPSVGTAGSASPSSATQIGGSDGTNLVKVKVSSAGVVSVDGSATTQPVSAASLPLPTGASTSANQTTGNSSLSSIDGKIPSNLTVSATRLLTDGSGVTQPVSGTVAVSNPGLTNTELRASAVPVSVASIPLATGAATEAKQDTQITSLGTINTTLGSPFQAGGSIGNTSFGISGTLPAFAATPTVNAAQSGTWNITNVSGTISLPTGAATSANQSTTNSLITTMSGKLPAALGAQTTTNSMAVNIASDQVLSTKTPINANASGSAAAATVSTQVVLSAPANAVGFVLMNLDTSTANIRWSLGRTSSATLGQQLQPGRDTGFIPYGGNVSITAESGTQNYDIQWVSQ
jgi:hypothetical protein